MLAAARLKAHPVPQFQQLRGTDQTKYHVAFSRDSVPPDSREDVPPCLVERVCSVPSVTRHSAPLGDTPALIFRTLKVIFE